MRQVLGDSDFDLDSDFFAEGGNSILAATVVELVENKTGVSLRIRTVLQNPTARSLAKAVAEL